MAEGVDVCLLTRAIAFPPVHRCPLSLAGALKPDTVGDSQSRSGVWVSFLLEEGFAEQLWCCTSSLELLGFTVQVHSCCKVFVISSPCWDWRCLPCFIACCARLTWGLLWLEECTAGCGGAAAQHTARLLLSLGF